MSIRILTVLGFGSLAMSLFGCSVGTGESAAATSEAVSTTPRELHVIAVTTSGGLRHALRTDTTWSGFGDVEGQAGEIGTVTDAETAVSVGGLHVIAIADGHLFHTIRTPDGGWFGFVDMALVLGNVGTHTSVGITNDGGQLGQTHVCTTTSTGRILHTIRDGGGGWIPWEDVKQKTGSPWTFKRVDCAARLVQATGCPPGQPLCFGVELQLVALRADGTPFHAIRHPDGTWTPLLSVNAATGNSLLFLDVDVDLDSNGTLNVIGTGPSFQYHAQRFATGDWSGFGDIEGQAGDPGNQANGAAVALDDGVYVFDQIFNGDLFITRRALDGSWDAFSNVNTATHSSEAFSHVSIGGLPSSVVP
jgi:hypothetical protein